MVDHISIVTCTKVVGIDYCSHIVFVSTLNTKIYCDVYTEVVNIFITQYYSLTELKLRICKYSVVLLNLDC